MKYLLITFILLVFGQLFAQDCAEGWRFYRTVTVDNTAGPELTNYQVKVQLNTLALAADGRLQANGNDLRAFQTDCTPLSFWGDSLGISTTTDVWVKVPSIAAGATVSLHLYYGKSDAPQGADGDNTFLFFDGFDGDTIDGGKWEPIGEFANFSAENGTASYGSTGSAGSSRFKFARTKAVFSERVVFDYAGIISNSNGFGFSSSVELLKRIIFRQAAFGFDTLNQVAFMQDTISNGIQVEGMYPLVRVPRGELTTQSITVGVNAEEHLEFTRFANVGLNSVNEDPYELMEVTTPGFHFIMSSFSQGNAIQLDNIRVRQFTPIPPTVSLGEQLIADPSGVAFLLSGSEVRIYPNPASDHCRVEVDGNFAVRPFLYDATGRRVQYSAVAVNGMENSWDLHFPTLTKGLYYLQLQRRSDSKLAYTQKLVVD